jgi:ligand-binding sensor domain-containing protein
MKNKIKTLTIGIVSISIFLLMIGCTGDEGKPKGLAQDIVDSITSPVVKQLAKAVKEQTSTNEVNEFTGSQTDIESLSHFKDMIIVDSKLYAVFKGGLLIYNFEDQSSQTYSIDDNLRAITIHDTKIYIGGSKLFSFDESGVKFIDDEFDGAITDLYSYEYRLMIGTENGLYSKDIFGKNKLMDDVVVSDMTADNSGLWIGTDGNGLYRWNGEIFKKRYLLRDTTIFDNVITLDFNHNHLYMGSENGFHVYNGGRWKTMTVAEGLPDSKITSIDASDWVVYIATDKGVVSFYNNELVPVSNLEGQQVNVIKRKGLQLAVATEYEGILLKSGNNLKTLIEATPESNINTLSLNF